MHRDFPSDLDERLWEWAHFFRDHRFRQQTCASAEKHFRPHSSDFAAEGWGDAPETAPRAPRPPRSILRAIQTHECIFAALDVPGRWAVTYSYCYPHLPRNVVLKALRHRTRRRYTWAAYCDLIDASLARVYTCLFIHAVRIDSSPAI